MKQFNWLKFAVMIITSILIYIGVAKLAITHYNIISLNLGFTTAITVSGGLGALLTALALQMIAQIKYKLTLYPLICIAGLMAGYVFSQTIRSESILINACGFITWQLLVFLAIYVSKKE